MTHICLSLTCHLEVGFFSLYDNFQMKYLNTLHGMDETTTTLKNFISCNKRLLKTEYLL